METDNDNASGATVDNFVTILKQQSEFSSSTNEEDSRNSNQNNFDNNTKNNKSETFLEQIISSINLDDVNKINHLQKNM